MLVVLGILVALAPFSGLPLRILAWVLPVVGALVLAIGISYRRERAASARKAPTHEATLPAS